MSSKRGLQGMITSLAEKEELNAYMDKLSPGDRARINCASQKFASTWLQSTASNTKLDNQHFAKALQLRLGTPGEHDSDPAAALSDPSIASKLKDRRHHSLAKVLTTWALRAGAERAETEPGDLWPDDNLTPDADIILGDRRLLVDVSVIHPTAPSYVVEARNPLGGSAHMVLTKEEKYAEMAAYVDAEVIPAVLETYGALSDSLIGLFKDIASYASTNPYLAWTPREIYRGLILDTSLTLQLWNAKIMMEGDRSSRDQPCA